MSLEEEIWYYRYLDLPKVPEKFLEESKNVLRIKRAELEESKKLQSLTSQWVQKVDDEKKEISYKMFRKLNDHGKTITSRSVVRFSVNEKFKQWISENITDRFIDASIAPSHKENEEDQVLGPHTDTTRDYLLLYLFDVSNADQTTIWWRENGHPIIRDRNVYTNIFKNMIKLKEVQFEKERWVILNARILHSVHNINGQRDAIQISLNDRLF